MLVELRTSDSYQRLLQEYEEKFLNAGLVAWTPMNEMSETQKVNKWIYDSGVRNGQMMLLNMLRGSK